MKKRTKQFNLRKKNKISFNKYIKVYYLLKKCLCIIKLMIFNFKNIFINNPLLLLYQ